MQIAQLLGLGFHPLIPQGFCLKMSASDSKTGNLLKAMLSSMSVGGATA